MGIALHCLKQNVRDDCMSPLSIAILPLLTCVNGSFLKAGVLVVSPVAWLRSSGLIALVNGLILCSASSLLAILGEVFAPVLPLAVSDVFVATAVAW